jgi:hypothetical protein
MCISNIGRYLGQVNIGYTDFQGQGVENNICGANPQLEMEEIEKKFEIIRVEGIGKYFGGEKEIVFGEDKNSQGTV